MIHKEQQQPSRGQKEEEQRGAKRPETVQSWACLANVSRRSERARGHLLVTIARRRGR